jgi:hypothetical protein
LKVGCHLFIKRFCAGILNASISLIEEVRKNTMSIGAYVKKPVVLVMDVLAPLLIG